MLGGRLSYRTFCAAFLRLQYLDGALVTPADIRAACVEGGDPQDFLATNDAGGSIEATARELITKHTDEVAFLYDANVDVYARLNAEIVACSKDMSLLCGLPRVAFAAHRFAVERDVEGTILRESNIKLKKLFQVRGLQIQGQVEVALNLTVIAGSFVMRFLHCAGGQQRNASCHERCNRQHIHGNL